MREEIKLSKYDKEYVLDDLASILIMYKYRSWAGFSRKQKDSTVVRAIFVLFGYEPPEVETAREALASNDIKSKLLRWKRALW